MPRKARIDIPGLLQHIIVRGIEQRRIFLDDIDRKDFLDRFSSLLEETDTDCFAWALLGNHFHLLLCCQRIKLSTFMKRLLTGYATHFNHRHNRSGHLFQNRYKSIVCEKDAYFLELIRYIHLNPLRARLVSSLQDLDSYPWCGHSVVMGKEKLPTQNVDEVLFQFGDNFSSARASYSRFIADGVSHVDRPEFVGGDLCRSLEASASPEDIENYDDRILGSGSFVKSIQEEADPKTISPPRLSLAEIQEMVCHLIEGVEPDLMLRRRKVASISKARALFCYIAVRLMGEKGFAVGNFLAMGPSGVSRAVTRGDQVLQDDQGLKMRLNELISQ